jgi:hypothetical protein
MKAAIKLFKAVPISEKNNAPFMGDILKETLPYGFVFAPEVYYNFNYTELLKLSKTVASILGLSGKQANSSFHKSWEKVANASMVQLVMEQIIHYFTTYGFESVGIYNSDSVYIPAEELNIPGLDLDKLELIVIHGLTKDELRVKLLDLLSSGIALAEDTISAVLDVALFVELTNAEVNSIKNKEVKVVLFDFLGLVPNNPIEFLRYVIFKATGKTLLIKDKVTIEMLKNADTKNLTGLFKKYEDEIGLESLATIFHRFKPLFLALRSNAFLKRKINRIRKLTDKYHVPMKEDLLNSVTAYIKRNDLNVAKLDVELSKVNIFRKIRLANALSYRINSDADSILYKIRNGKSFATEFSFDNKAMAFDALIVTIESIAENLRPTLEGKSIYIPDNIVYSLPATEKQFTGYFPSGTYIKVNSDLIAGVYWENLDNYRIDLDLSLVGLGIKIGWDARYRTSERDVLFSGDMTDASNGASELYYLKGQKPAAYLLMLNYYNSRFGAPVVPFKIMAASEVVRNFEGRRKTPYMINPNNMIAVSSSKITANQKQKVIGLITTIPGECRFYFSEFNIGNSITSGFRTYNEQTRKYLVDYHQTLIGLKDVLSTAGAIFVDSPEKCDIDLSPTKLEKDTFVKLLTNK